MKTYRLKVTVKNETSSVFITERDARHIAGDHTVINAKEGEKIKITPTMIIEVLVKL